MCTLVVQAMQDETIWKVRELEILRLMAGGLTDAEIGARLHLAHETVRWYNKHIYQKLDVVNRTQAVRRATVLGLLDETSVPASATPTPVRATVRYVANGNVHIAYAVTGSGPVDLLFIHGFLSHLELAWEEPEFVAFFERLGRHARVILFDKRGVGLSDRIQGAPTLEDTISDARAVLDAAGSERAFIMGTSESGAAAALLAATYPERVRGLILYATTSKLVRDGDEPPWASTADGIERFIDGFQKAWGGPWALSEFAPSRAHDERFRAWWARILRSASSPSSFRAVMSMLQQIDIRDLLPQVRARTLVIHKRGDRMVNVAAGRYLADHLPNALWVELAGEDHIYFVDSDGLLAAVARFIEEPASSVVDTRIALILAVKGESDPLPPIVAAMLADFSPEYSLVDAKEGMAIFDSPSRAVRCARRLRETSLRVGLHVGECHSSGSRPLDYVAAMTREVAETAAPGEILVTRALRDILGGMDLSFQPVQHPQRKSSPADTPLLALV